MSEKSQLDRICDLGKRLNITDFEIYKFDNSKIEEKYGEINLVKIKLGNPAGNNLLVTPGYSFNSFSSMTEKLYEGFDYIKSKYSNLYIVNWGDKIKKDSSKVGEGKTEQERFILNDVYRNELAHLLNKCLRIPEINLQNITLLGKSAGGGVAICLAAINTNVKLLLLVAPGMTSRGKELNVRPELPIHISWNTDDDVIHWESICEFKSELISHAGRYVKLYIYEVGGHELNVKFLRDTFNI